MPDLNGLDFVRSLEEPPKVIFTGTPTRYWAADAKEWAGMFLHENDNKYFIWELQYATDAAKTLGNTEAYTLENCSVIHKFRPKIYQIIHFFVQQFANVLFFSLSLRLIIMHTFNNAWLSVHIHDVFLDLLTYIKSYT